MTNSTGFGSEGDAYRYTKKVLMGLPNVSLIREIYEDVADQRYNKALAESIDKDNPPKKLSWTREAYMDLRRTFFRDGQCKIRFAPGVARIAFGELRLGTGDEQPVQITALHDMVRIVSIAHAGEYTRYLTDKDGRTMTFSTLTAMYGVVAAANWSSMKRKLRRMKYGPRSYRIIELDSFETASKYYQYTEKHSWCHFKYPDMFERYSMVKSSEVVNGMPSGSQNLVRLYLAVLPGFEDMDESDELFGESMLGIDIGPGGRLIHVNNRWNHDHDNVDERKGDNKYNEIELSMLLGGPYFEICPPFTVSDERRHLKSMADAINKGNRPYYRKYDSLMRRLRMSSGRISDYRRVVDERDGSAYETKRYGGVSVLKSPLHYVPDGYKKVFIPHDFKERIPVDKKESRVYVLSVRCTFDGELYLVWVPDANPAFENLGKTSNASDEDDKVTHFPVKCQLNEDAVVTVWPKSTNRVIMRSTNGTYYAARRVLGVFLPVILVNGLYVSLHPSYDSIVAETASFVKFIRSPDDDPSKPFDNCGYMRTYDNHYMRNFSNERENLLRYVYKYGGSWRMAFDSSTMMPKIIELAEAEFRRPVDARHVYELIDGMLLSSVFYVDAEDGSTTTTTSYIVQDFDNEDTQLIDPAPPTNNISYTDSDCIVHNDRIVHMIEDCNVNRRNNVRYSSPYSSKERHIPDPNVLYPNTEALSTIHVDNTDAVVPFKLDTTEPMGHPENGLVVFPSAGPFAGYLTNVIYVPSDTPITQIELDLVTASHESNIVVEYGDGGKDDLWFYPRNAKEKLENKKFRFIEPEEVYSLLGALGFVKDMNLLNPSTKSTKYIMSGNARAEDSQVRLYANRHKNRAKGSRIGGGMQMPVKAQPELAYPLVTWFGGEPMGIGANFVVSNFQCRDIAGVKYDEFEKKFAISKYSVRDATRKLGLRFGYIGECSTPNFSLAMDKDGNIELDYVSRGSLSFMRYFVSEFNGEELKDPDSLGPVTYFCPYMVRRPYGEKVLRMLRNRDAVRMLQDANVISNCVDAETETEPADG